MHKNMAKTEVIHNLKKFFEKINLNEIFRIFKNQSFTYQKKEGKKGNLLLWCKFPLSNRDSSKKIISKYTVFPVLSPSWKFQYHALQY